MPIWGAGGSSRRSRGASWLVRQWAGLRLLTHPWLPTSVLSCSARGVMSAARVATLPRCRHCRRGRASGRTHTTGRGEATGIVQPRARGVLGAPADSEDGSAEAVRSLCRAGVAGAGAPAVALGRTGRVCHESGPRWARLGSSCRCDAGDRARVEWEPARHHGRRDGLREPTVRVRSPILAALVGLDAVAVVVKKDRAALWQRRLTSPRGSSGSVGRDDDHRLVYADALAAQRAKGESTPLHQRHSA
jgi:hypothetical protein